MDEKIIFREFKTIKYFHEICTCGGTIGPSVHFSKWDVVSVLRQTEGTEQREKLEMLETKVQSKGAQLGELEDCWKEWVKKWISESRKERYFLV